MRTGSLRWRFCTKRRRRKQTSCWNNRDWWVHLIFYSSTGIGSNQLASTTQPNAAQSYQWIWAALLRVGLIEARIFAWRFLRCYELLVQIGFWVKLNDVIYFLGPDVFFVFIGRASNSWLAVCFMGDSSTCSVEVWPVLILTLSFWHFEFLLCLWITPRLRAHVCSSCMEVDLLLLVSGLKCVFWAFTFYLKHDVWLVFCSILMKSY